MEIYGDSGLFLNDGTWSATRTFIVSGLDSAEIPRPGDVHPTIAALRISDDEPEVVPVKMPWWKRLFCAPRMAVRVKYKWAEPAAE